MKKQTVIMALLVLSGVCSVFAVPLISDVNMIQRENSRIVDITYTLADETAIVTLGIETNGVALSGDALTTLAGDVSRVVSAGSNKHIIWNAGNDWPENLSTNARAKVTAWATNSPPQYMVIDLGTAAPICPVYYYPGEAAIPGGVTNVLYKTERLVLRRLSTTGGAGFYMGSPVTEVGRRVASEDRHVVELTQDFYIGVYELTQKQWYYVMGTSPAKKKGDSLPVETVSYYHIRENSDNTTMGTVWPETMILGPNSFMSVLRSKVGGVVAFDLPTDAQWEYACRAGTTGALNDGTINATATSMNLLGRHSSSGSGTTTVGSYLPNAWGIYDMHGNVWEWVADWFIEEPQWSVYYSDTGAVDPVGISTAVAAAKGYQRIIRGGAFNSGFTDCRSALRSGVTPNYLTISSIGFRVAGNLP